MTILAGIFFLFSLLYTYMPQCVTLLYASYGYDLLSYVTRFFLAAMLALLLSFLSESLYNMCMCARYFHFCTLNPQLLVVFFLFLQVSHFLRSDALRPSEFNISVCISACVCVWYRETSAIPLT